MSIVLRDGGNRTGVLITADVLDFDRVMVEAIRRAITHKHGIPAENIMLAASHTHWGPAIRFQMSYSVGGPNVWYMGLLEDKILASVGAAIEDLAPAVIEYGRIDFRAIGCNRRLPANGGIGWGPYREGSYDGHTPILRIKRGTTPQQLVVVGHACHPTSSGTIGKWSPDYPGAMRDSLTRALPDTKALFVQGCGGDAKIVHNDPETGKLAFSSDPKRARAAGEKLAEAVRTYLQAEHMVPLLRRNWMTWAARQALARPDTSESFRYDVQVWQLGGQLTIFGMEGEICSPWGPMLRAMAPAEQAMVIGYANSTSSYIPDRKIVREGGYEGMTSQHAYALPAPFTENIESEIKQIVARALDGVKP